MYPRWPTPSSAAARGFTLIELLVVVLIIGLLAAIALPRFLTQRNRARNAAAQASLRHALLAARSYYTQNSESYAGLGPSQLQGYESSLSGTEPADSLAPGTGANPQDIWIGNGVDGTNPTSGDANGGKKLVLCTVSRGDTVYCVRDVDGVASYFSAGDAVDGVANTPSTTVTAMTGGWDHHCALLSDATVKCWGAGIALGNGSSSNRNLPVAVSNLSGVAAISGGGWFTCALLSGGTVKCWGKNDLGQLGDGTTTDSLVPVTVPGLSGVVSLGTGYGHTCVLLQDGTGRCWGLDYESELGDSAYTALYQTTPKTVTNLSGASSLISGWYHNCALFSGGSVKCWGFNGNGQLGNASTGDRDTATSITALSNVSMIRGGRHHTCAISGSTLQCWGSNSSGQVGDGSTADRTTPTIINGLAGTPLAVGGGEYHTCALTQGGGVQCWGKNNAGQLGDGSNTDRTTPTQVSGLTSGVSMISPAGTHTCVLMTYGAVKCWGLGGYGDLGDGTWSSRNVPAAVKGL